MEMKKRHVVYAVVIFVIVAMTVFALLPSPVPVETEMIERGAMTVAIDARGETRVRDRFVVTAPISGTVSRIELREGEIVERDALLATIAPAQIDPRQREEAAARVESARALVREASASVAAAGSAAALARSERERGERLARDGIASEQSLEQLLASEERADRELDAARERLGSARANLAATEATLLTPPGERGLVAVRAPAAGRIFRIPERSERVVQAGTTLLEIGETQRLELILDVLSEDAVRIAPGNRVVAEHWGGDEPLHGTVRLVEPSAFTKISALGIEEQRVWVIADLDAAPPELGDAYRVEAQVVIWESPDVLKVPISALARSDDGWSVFRAEGNRAVRTPIEIGRRNPLEAELVAGLEEGDAVIVHPSLEVEDGIRIRRLD